MLTIEERVRKLVEANWGDKQATIHGIVREIHLLQAALPAPDYLESVASQLEVTCVQEVDLINGTTFNGPVFLRQAARLVRLAISEGVGPEDEAMSEAMSSAARVGTPSAADRT
jgi:hypothetical protein